MKHKLASIALGVCASLSVSAVALAEEPRPSDLPSTTHSSDAEQRSTSWRTHQTDHFTLLYAGQTAPAIHHADLLERAHERFHQAFGEHPFQLEPPRDPLIALYFEDKTDYLRYARQTDRVDMSWTVAYYSAKTNRVAFFRYGRTASEATASPSSQADSEGTSAFHQPEAATSPAIRPIENALALASATHEAAHQLAFNTGLQQRGVIYPLWASEGLATNFELTEQDGAFGPEVENASRATRLGQAWREQAVRPLAEFITVTRVPTDDARATDELYAQACGLFRFLYLHRREGLADYLAAMRDAPRGHRHARDLQDDFTAAFGSIDAVERDWQHWLAVRYGG